MLIVQTRAHVHVHVHVCTHVYVLYKTSIIYIIDVILKLFY